MFGWHFLKKECLPRAHPSTSSRADERKSQSIKNFLYTAAILTLFLIGK
jgi:hypothetical protein